MEKPNSIQTLTKHQVPTKAGSDSHHEIHPLLLNRWSPRAFSEEPIDSVHLNSLFEAMRWAPSSMNEQPWRIIFARQGDEAFEKIAESLNESNRIWASKAPVLMLTLTRKTFTRSGEENVVAKHDLGLAIGNLSVQATALGIGLHQMAGFSRSKARTLFNIPEDFDPVSCIAIGYFGDPEQLPEHLRERELAPRRRKAIEEFAFEGHFKKD